VAPAADTASNTALLVMIGAVVVVVAALGAVVAGVRPRRRARPVPTDRP